MSSWILRGKEGGGVSHIVLYIHQVTANQLTTDGFTSSILFGFPGLNTIFKEPVP
jgi:hypothetical protein